MRFGESMEQTFDDLCREWAKNTPVTFGFLLRIFVDTAIGVGKENMSQVLQKGAFKNIVLSPWPAAMVSVLLCLPFAVTLVPLLEIDLLTNPLRAVFTIDGQQLNMIGRIMVFGGTILLPVALLLNLVPMFTMAGGTKRISFSPRPVNLIAGLAVLLPILIMARWMILEAISCSNGICD